MSSRKRERMEQTSHKVIEKRRRDRINNCLSELSQTVPAAFSKQTSGKLEKAEILEMTVEYLRAVQATEIGIRFDNGEWFSADIWSDFAHHYQSGYGECLREVVKYMADVEGVSMSDARCVRLVSFLQNRFRPDAQSASAAAGSCSTTGSGPCLTAGSGSVVNNGSANAYVGNSALFPLAGEFRRDGSSSSGSAQREVVSTSKTAPPKLVGAVTPLLACYPSSYLSAAAAAAAFAATTAAGDHKTTSQHHQQQPHHPAAYPASLAVVDPRSCRSLPAFSFAVDLPRFAHTSKDVAAMFAHGRSGVAASRIMAAAAGSELFVEAPPGLDFAPAFCQEAAGRKEPRAGV